VPQALGSKAGKKAKRQKRRKSRKEAYAEYLRGDEWKKIRARILKRDNDRCRASGKPAHAVHHRRYPQKLGEERSGWLFSVCTDCHAAIHRIAEGMPLRKATDLIIAPKRAGIVRLADDPQLSARETRRRQSRKGYFDQGSRPKKRKVRPQHIRDKTKHKAKLIQENERLHEELKRNRKRRERRMGL
jgi:hypothetical protein